MTAVRYVIQWKKNRQGRWTDYDAYHGLDFAEAMIDKARKKYPSSIFRIRKRQQPKTQNA